MVLVLLLATSISVVLIRIYYRCALLQQTVAAREKQLIFSCGAQACMQYAIYLAKANWDYFAIQSDELVFSISWALSKKVFVPAIIVFRSEPKAIHINVQLFDKQQRLQQCVACSIRQTQQGKITIFDWYDL